MLKEFKKFISRGNVIDLAVGIVIGAAFTSVVKSLVDDIIMPPIGLLTGGVDFSELYINLSGEHYPSLTAASAAGAPLIRYGVFLNNVISFLIVAFAVFLLVRAYNRILPPPPPPPPSTKPCPFCCEPVALNATRCGHCTSELGEVAV